MSLGGRQRLDRARGHGVFLAVAEAQFAVDVFYHYDGAVNEDAEVDRADGEQIGGQT